jgi:hypothetical protein
VDLRPLDKPFYRHELEMELQWLSSRHERLSVEGLRESAEQAEELAIECINRTSGEPGCMYAYEYDVHIAARDARLQLAAAMEAGLLATEALASARDAHAGQRMLVSSRCQAC